jgi:hypothetical protein
VAFFITELEPDETLFGSCLDQKNSKLSQPTPLAFASSSNCGGCEARNSQQPSAG